MTFFLVYIFPYSEQIRDFCKPPYPVRIRENTNMKKFREFRKNLVNRWNDIHWASMFKSRSVFRTTSNIWDRPFNGFQALTIFLNISILDFDRILNTHLKSTWLLVCYNRFGSSFLIIQKYFQNFCKHLKKAVDMKSLHAKILSYSAECVQNRARY